MIEHLIVVNKIKGFTAYISATNPDDLKNRLLEMNQLLLSTGGSARITVEPLTPEQWQEARGKRRCPKCEEKARKEKQ